MITRLTDNKHFDHLPTEALKTKTRICLKMIDYTILREGRAADGN